MEIVLFISKDAYSIVLQEAKEKEIIPTPCTLWSISNAEGGNTLRDAHIVADTLTNASVKTKIDGFHERRKKIQRNIDSVEESLISTEDNISLHEKCQNTE